MAQRAFFLNRLRDGVDPRDYERFVREVDYPFASRIPTIRSYVVTRVDGLLEGEGKPPYDYLEVVEITEVDAYRASLDPSQPDVKEFFDQWSSFVGESLMLWGEVID
jgi:hypothetical protein